MEKKSISDFGKSIKLKLIEINKTQNWLICELQKNLPNNYIDGSLLYKIIVGDISKGKVVDEIKKILELKSEDNSEI